MIKFTLKSFSGTQWQRERAKRVLALAEDIVNGEEYRKRFLAFDFLDEKGEPLAASPLWEKMQAADEGVLKEGPDQEWDIHWHVIKKPWYNRSSAIGYGYPGSIDIYTYSSFYDNVTEAELAGHLVHEHVHKLGGDHPFNWTSWRDRTWPYAAGDLVVQVAKGVVPKDETPPEKKTYFVPKWKRPFVAIARWFRNLF